MLLVCIDAHPKTRVLLRAAANKAKDLGIPWTVLYVETENHYIQDEESRERILKYLTLAGDMGAEVRQVENKYIARGIVSFVIQAALSEKPVTHLIIGQSPKEGFFNELKASLAEKVARELRKTNTEVQIIPLTQRHYTPTWFERLYVRDLKISEIGFSLLAVLYAFLASEFLQASISSIEWQINSQNVMAFFLIACILTSLRYGLLPGLISAIVSFVVINYFYVMPLHNFTIVHSSEGISLSIFLVSAVVVSFMGAFTQASNSALARKEKRSQALYAVHKLASNASDPDEVLEILYNELHKLLEMDIAFFMPPAVNPDAIELAYPHDIVMDKNDKKSLKLCWEGVRTTGLGTIDRFDSSWRFEPLVTPNGEIGVLGIKVPKFIRLDASFGRLLSALADQAANILERIELTKMMSESKMREEREKLRAMLLSAVSHDLKTPLASIIGSLSVYRRLQKAGRLDQKISDELTETALEEAQRLNSFITNILDMTRIESGDIAFSEEWVNPAQILTDVQKRLRLRLQDHTFTLQPCDAPAEVKLDVMMTEQVLQNVIDNAAKYAPTGTEIIVSYAPSKNNEGFEFKVRDQGTGIPEDKLLAIFDKYERLRQSDNQVAGTGLGLAICKAVMEKQGGTIHVSNHPQGGAEFTIWFPHWRPENDDNPEENATRAKDRRHAA